MATSSVAINWPSPTGLIGEKVKDTNNLIGNAARFTWDKITDISMQELDPSGGGYLNIYWRVQINNGKIYSVFDNPTFTMAIPAGCCKLCVNVQTVYILHNSPQVLALSEFCDESCVECDPDPYCNNPNKSINNVKSSNVGSVNMRYSRAIRLGGKNAFR